MNFFEKIIYGLAVEMPTPKMYGVFHIISLVVVIGLTALLCWKCRNCSDKTFKWIIASAWIVLVVLELIKQLVFSFHYDGTKVYWKYEWHGFPFHLCSAPLYILPFIAFRKNGKFRDSLFAFMGSFVLFGGIVTMLVPATVFVEFALVNVQTMVHHGTQIVLGVFILVHERKRLNLKFFIPALYVFMAMFALALSMNFIMKEVITEPFNMFYISPYYPCVIPLLDIIYANTPYVVFLLIYVIGFSLAGFGVYMAQYGLIKLAMKQRKEKPKK